MSSTDNRPTSPHVQVYRLPLTAVLSIAFRAAGAFLALGLLLLIWLLVAAASGPDYYQVVHSMAASWFGQLVLFGFTFALYYHLCNGVRHLYWDMGYGFEKESVAKSVWVVLAVSVGLTVVTWLVAYIV
ncbi:MAG: succinate dehydrogenase, cytochrome b556 subunit [Gammaproteobacteria bacterium]|nr:succinate dehydrogenase, cytochrome b556 subunit [Gammaproteobacteria bacterium]